MILKRKEKCPFQHLGTAVWNAYDNGILKNSSLPGVPGIRGAQTMFSPKNFCIMHSEKVIMQHLNIFSSYRSQKNSIPVFQSKSDNQFLPFCVLYLLRFVLSHIFILYLLYFGGHCHFYKRSLQCWSCQDSYCSHPERSSQKQMRHTSLWSTFTEKTKAFVLMLADHLYCEFFLYAAFCLNMVLSYYLVCWFGDGILLIIQQHSVSTL